MSRPSEKDLWFLPLGGCGEIGMNLNLIGHDHQWLMIDCGITFNSDLSPTRVELPDPQFVLSIKDALCGIVLTHAHEDHIGALPYLFELLGSPTLYATAFTAGVIREKFRRLNIHPDIHPLEAMHETVLGPFTITPLPITHSIPETQALLISTPAGNLLHTADWKIDDAPVAGTAYDHDRFNQASLPSLNAVLCDSTNALSAGHSKSEHQIALGLERLIRQCQGRVIVSCFASNIARLQTLGRIASRTDRHLALSGRALERMTRIAKSCGYLNTDFPLISSRELAYFPGRYALFVATGSQGEPGATLTKLARDQHPDFKIQPDDVFIFSSKTIPGNEVAIEQLVAQIQAQGATVYQAEALPDLDLHASGHPNQEELAHFYASTRPKLAVPLHGETRHLEANAKIAQAQGIHRTLTGKNGDLFSLTEPFNVRRKWTRAGRLFVDERARALHPVLANEG